MDAKLWRDMTPEEKGALLLAYHEGKVIEYKWFGDVHFDEAYKNRQSKLGWHDDCFYRVKHEPVVKEVVMFASSIERFHARHPSEKFWVADQYDTPAMTDTHKITFNIVDGVPDCNSIKMEKL